MGFFSELKRRNVFRVALAYVLAAWVLLQAIDFVLDAISAPNWIVQVFILAALAGFLVVVVFSWVFEVTPEGIKREKDIDRTQSISPQTGRKLDRVIIAFMAVAIVVLLADRFIGTNESPSGEGHQAIDTATEPQAAPEMDSRDIAADEAGKNHAAAQEKSLAVLPFVSLSSGADDGYFADGLTEEILNALAQLPELLVTARTSSFHFKNQDIPVQQIAATLGVAHIVEGSVRRSGDRLRVTVQLVRASDGFHLWSENYDSTLEDSIQVQELIAGKIAQAMNVVMDDNKRAAMQRSGLRDGDTFIAYQKGRELYFAAHGETDQINTLRQANRYLDVVLEREPEYSPAYRLHSDLFAHIVMAHASNQPMPGVSAEEIDSAMAIWDENYRAAIQYARNIEERNDLEFDYALLTMDWEGFPESIELFVSAQACLDPLWGVSIMFPYGYAEKSRPRFRQLRQCDPLNSDTWETEANAALWALDPAGAETTIREGMKILSGLKMDRKLFQTQLASGQFEAAEELLQRTLMDEDVRAEFEFMLKAAQGDREAARLASEAWLALFANQNTDYPELLVSARMGDRDTANRMAARLDQNPYGNLALLDLVVECICGAPWELSATPNFAAKFSESGLNWPPVSPIHYPLKDW